MGWAEALIKRRGGGGGKGMKFLYTFVQSNRGGFNQHVHICYIEETAANLPILIKLLAYNQGRVNIV